jgi:hypothetical protein
MTIGIVEVACFAANATAADPNATITATRKPTISAQPLGPNRRPDAGFTLIVATT